MGKKGKGKGKGQAADSSSQGAQERPRRAPQQVYQVPPRRDQQGPTTSRQRPEDVATREQPVHSQASPVQASASQQPHVEKEQKPPQPTSSGGVGRGRGASKPQSQKVGTPTGSFFEKEAPKKSPPVETPFEISGKKPLATTQKKAQEDPELLLKVAGLSISAESFPISHFPMAKRPNYGELGRRIGLCVNYFQLKYKNLSIYHYDIDILEATKDKKAGISLMSVGRTAKEDIQKKVKHVERQKRRNIGKAKCRQIIAAMCKSEALVKFCPVYDGQKNLFTSKPLPFKEKKTIEVNLKIDDDDKKFFVAIQPVLKKNGTNCIDMQPLLDLYNKRSCEVPQEVLLVFETIMNHRDPPFNQVQFRNSFFPLRRENVCPLGLGMEIWFGYNQSVHLTQRGPVLIINMAAKAFHKSGPVIEFAKDALEKDITRMPKFDPWMFESLEKALKGLLVKVTHQKHSRKYKIKGLTKATANDITFDHEGKKVSVVRYFQLKYRINLAYPHLPCLLMQSTNNTSMPMEVCTVVEGQPKIGKLSPDMTSKMIKSTAVPPDKRFQTICNDAKKIQAISKHYMDSYGLLLDINLTKVDGRLITAPKLQYGDSKLATPDNKGVWRIEDGKKFYSVINVKSWALISFANEHGQYGYGQQVLDKYCHFLVQSAKKCGMQMERPKFIQIYGRNVTTEKAIAEAKRSGIDFVIIVLNRRDKFHTYDEVKFLADYKYRLVSQCMEDKTLGRINDQITTNVCLKINVKLGGINHILRHDLKMFRTPVMVIGADAIHWTRGTGYPSIVSVVASYEPTASRYMLVCDTQRNERSGKISQEIIRNMKDIAKKLIEAFHEKARGRYPERIIVFRDGVSDGQFQHALDYEVSGIQQACLELMNDVKPITFIIVQKRHQTRMCPQNPADGVGRGRNVPPGTVVDRDITHPVHFDFFVCSHEGIQGTSKPAHYTVLHDDNKFTADELQQLCHFLCHTYVRCTRSVSLPAPVMYADLAAFRAKKYADLFVDSDSASTSSFGEDIEKELPKNVMEAIKSMNNFDNAMFYV